MKLLKEQKDFLKLIIEFNKNYTKEQKECLKNMVESSVTIEELGQKITLTMIL